MSLPPSWYLLGVWAVGGIGRGAWNEPQSGGVGGDSPCQLWDPQCMSDQGEEEVNDLAGSPGSTWENIGPGR